MADQKKNQSGGFNPIGLCLGLSIGLSFGVSMDNLSLGLCLGMGVGLCFSVALGQRKADDDKPEDKSDDGSGEEGK